MAPKPKYLQKNGRGPLFHYSDQLAARKDMFPTNGEDGGSSRFDSIPTEMQAEWSAMLGRLTSLENQYGDLKRHIIARFPGGAEAMEEREPVATIPAKGLSLAEAMTNPTLAPQSMPPLTPGAGTKPVAPSQADNVQPTLADAGREPVAAQDPKLARLKQAVDDAEDKVASQQRYFEERTEIANAAREEAAEAGSAVDTSDEGEDREAAQALADEAAQKLKQAQQKEKSATTKLANAEKQLQDAREALAAGMGEAEGGDVKPTDPGTADGAGSNAAGS